MVELEDQLDRVRDASLLRDYLKPGLTDFDFVLIDTPGNVDRRCKIVVAEMVMSDLWPSRSNPTRSHCTLCLKPSN